MSVQSIDLRNKENEELMQKMKDALEQNDPRAYGEAFMQYHTGLQQSLRDEYEQYIATNDVTILQNRDVRQLTSSEKKYYQLLIDASKSSDFKQAINNIDVAMPETIITDVYRDLTEEHDLLNYIDFTPTSYATRWILNDHTTQTAIWGNLTEGITKEITSAFKEIKLNQHKLTAFFLMDMSMLELGPEWVDVYVRTVLKDSLQGGIEKEIIGGNGLKGPVGMRKDIAKGKFNDGTGYPDKQKVKLKSFRPKEYGTVLSSMAKTESGKKRKFNSVLLICNMTDYLTKVMPATTAETSNREYVRDVFPFPTTICISNELADGEAILTLPKEYFFGLGSSSKDGQIQHSDEVKFLEDKRAYKIKLHGNGMPRDNTCSILLDISEMEELYTVVKLLNDAAREAKE